MTKYLQRRYSFFGTSRQNEELQKILTRLQISGKFEKGALSVIVDALLNEGELGSLEIKQVINKEDTQTVEDAKTILLDENLMFEEYIETVDIGELNRDHLLEIGKKICLERGETELL